jgi:peroxiredoxin
MAKLLPGDALIDFTLPATDGNSYHASEIVQKSKALAVVFTCNHCPYAQAWEDRINQIARDYAGKGIRVLAINANDASKYPGDSFEQMTRRAKEKQFVFPYLQDESQAVARAYGAVRTPEFFIFDAASKLCYHGAPDDNYEEERQVRHSYVREALDAILARQPVAIPDTPAVGCTIKWKA